MPRPNDSKATKVRYRGWERDVIEHTVDGSLIIDYDGCLMKLNDLDEYAITAWTIPKP